MGAARPIAVLGAGGLVGSALMKALTKENPVPLGRAECDLTNPDQILAVMDKLRPRIFFNAAAFTDVDRCEFEPEAAYRLNALGPGYLAQAAREIGCLLVHFSTDYVFNGDSNRPYREEDRPEPLSVYGRTKLAGEKAVQSAGGDWLIIRTAGVYGHPRRGFIWRILDLAGHNQVIRVVDDQTGSPTYAPDLAEGAAALIKVGAKGLVHLAGGGQATWWELARLTLDLAGLKQIPVERIKSADLNRPAPRPSFSVLDTTRFQTLTGRSLRPWPEALASALKAEGEASGESTG